MRFSLVLILAAVFAVIGYNKVSSGWEEAKSSTKIKPKGRVKTSTLTEDQMKYKAAMLQCCNAAMLS